MINALEGIEFSVDPTKADVDEIVIPINFRLATTWWSENPEESDKNLVQIRLFSPDSEDLGGPDLEMAFGESSYSRFTVNIQGFPYKGDGVYRYIIFHVLEDQPVEVQQIPIKVKQIQSNDPVYSGTR